MMEENDKLLMDHMKRRYHDLWVQLLNTEQNEEGNKIITIVPWMETEIKLYAGIDEDDLP